MGYIVYELSCGLWAVGLGCLWGAMGCGKGVLHELERCFLNLESQSCRFRTAKSSCVFFGV